MSGTLRQWTTVVGSVRNNWWPPHRCGKRWYQRPVDQVWEIRAQQWQTIMGINLTGVWHTLKAAAPIMIDQSLGGSIILVCSVGGLKPLPAKLTTSQPSTGSSACATPRRSSWDRSTSGSTSIHPWAVETPMGDPGAVVGLLERHPTFRGLIRDDPAFTIDRTTPRHR
jgi:NAD(P)-dependent dehydrogenase (short-subunit alcohol dehydrogenase family)